MKIDDLLNKQDIEKIGFLDIETSNLSADFGFIFSYAIKDNDSNKIYGRVLTPNEIKDGVFDKELVKECCKDMYRFNRIITYYGTYFDLPFIRTRAEYFNYQYPKYKDILHTDCYHIVKTKLKIHSNRLETACNFLNIPSKKHRLSGVVWVNACAGKKKYLDFIFEHNKEDVISLQNLYKRLERYYKKTKRSI